MTCQDKEDWRDCLGWSLYSTLRNTECIIHLDYSSRGNRQVGWSEFLKGTAPINVISRAIENLGGFLLKGDVRVVGMENNSGCGVSRLAGTGKRLLLSRKRVPGV